MICNLSHLHNETKDVGVVVEKHALSDVSIKLALAVGHNTVGEIILRFTEELAIDIDLLDR